MAQRLKRLSAMRETWVRSLGLEDPLEKEMATHSSILAWRIPWTEEHSGGYTVHGVAESDTTERLHFLSLSFFHLCFIISKKVKMHLKKRFVQCVGKVL